MIKLQNLKIKAPELKIKATESEIKAAESELKYVHPSCSVMYICWQRKGSKFFLIQSTTRRKSPGARARRGWGD
jgi:hypothetical protein